MKPRYILAIAAAVLLTGRSDAQKKPPLPEIEPPAVSGVRPGDTVELTLVGKHLQGAMGLDVGTPAEVKVLDSAADGTQVRVRLTMPAGTPIGAYPLRLAASAGLSNVRLFCVDDLPAVSGDDLATFPCVAVGRLEAQKPRVFKFKAAAGQRLSFDLLGRRLGSQLDATLTLKRAGVERPLAFVDDTPGCQGDPRFAHTFKEAGDYTLELRDGQQRRGPECFYRLRVGDLPLVQTPYPPVARRGSKVKVELTGAEPMEVNVPDAPWLGTIEVHPKGAWPVTLRLTDHDEGIEQEPNDTPAQATRVSFPGGVSGRFDRARDVDCFVFAAHKGQALVAQARTLELGSPAIVEMALRQAKTGKELAKAAEHRLDFTPTEDGDLIVEMRSYPLLGGPGEKYHLTIRPAADFELSAVSDRVEGTSVVVQATRRGYTGPIELTVHGLPSTGGTAALGGKGQIKGGETSTTLTLQVPPDLPAGAYGLAIVGRGAGEIRLVNVRAAVARSLNDVPFPPLALQNRLELRVGDKK